MKNVKKIIAGILAAAMVMVFSVPCMAETTGSQVFVNFICDGVTSGKYVPAGSNVTAPAVPLHAGFTFCGFDKSLYNVTTNTTFVAVYVDNSLGEAAINQKKASLPTPAVTATTVADPNAAAPAVSATTAATAAAAATPASQAAALLEILKAQQAAVTTASANNALGKAAAAAQAAAPAVQAAAQNAAQAAQTPAAQAAAQNLAQAAQAAAQNPAVQAAANQAIQTVTATAAVLPSWAVPLHGVDQAGAAEVYKYWKTVKNTDDATIQANWDALLNHYAGHGTQGW